MYNYMWCTRAQRVIEMDRLVRELIDDEDIFETWLIYGVADGDIDKYTTWDEVDDYYLSDGNYEELCSLFKRLMALQANEEA